MRWLCRLVTTWEVPTAVPGRRWELRMLEDAGCKKPAFPSADGYALPLTATVGWVSYVCQEHHETLTRSGLRTVREGRSYSSPSFIQTGPGKFRVTAWHGWWIQRRVSVWRHPACPSTEVCNVPLDNGWRRLETCPKNGVLEGMMKNDHFSQSKELLIKLPASFAQGWPREHWLS